MQGETRLESGGTPQTAGCFPTTQWSLVLVAGDHDSPEADAALAGLCRCYWFPVYAYIRRTGHDADAAQDLTQDFFSRLAERRFFTAANRGKGRFRSFLLTVLKRFLVNEWQRSQAAKRGGGREILSLDAAAAEERYRLEPADHRTADRLYDRRWVLALLDRVMDALQREHTAAGQEALFDQLRVFLYGDKSPRSQAEIGARMGLSESAVKSTVHRLRIRYRELLRAEVARTLASPLDVEDELRQLLQVLRD